jgi:hypothetical protein
MKYYIYISDAKVDMLLPQIPYEAKKKIATELKIDFKVFSASRKTEQGEDTNRITRLEAVSKFIFEYGDVGTPDDPGEYIADTLSMRWGPLGYWESKDTPIVYFGGVTENTLVGLTGSEKHVLGNTSTGSFYAGSNHIVLVYSLARRYKLNPKDQSKVLKLEQSLNEMEMSLHSRPMSEPIIERLTIDAVYHASHEIHGPEQRLEFLAKRLFYGEAHGRKVILATPLYVAMAE